MSKFRMNSVTVFYLSFLFNLHLSFEKSSQTHFGSNKRGRILTQQLSQLLSELTCEFYFCTTEEKSVRFRSSLHTTLVSPSLFSKDANHLPEKSSNSCLLAPEPKPSDTRSRSISTIVLPRPNRQCGVLHDFLSTLHR